MKVEACVLVGMALVAGCVGLKPDPTLVYHQKFDDAALKAAVGTWTDGKMGEGEIVSGKFGNALHIPAGKRGAIVDVPAGTIGAKGCIEFWAKLDNGEGRMTSIFNPSLFALEAKGAGRLSIGFTTNEGHGDSGLQYHFWGVAYSASHRGCSSHAYSEILPDDPSGWHHYALVWNCDDAEESYKGEPLVVYIDGVKRYTAGKAGVKGKGVKHVDWLDAKQTLSFSYSGVSRSGYTIDEVKVWTTDKRIFDGL